MSFILCAICVLYVYKNIDNKLIKLIFCPKKGSRCCLKRKGRDWNLLCILLILNPLPFCDSVGARTQDLLLRRQLLYPAELRNQLKRLQN